MFYILHIFHVPEYKFCTTMNIRKMSRFHHFPHVPGGCVKFVKWCYKTIMQIYLTRISEVHCTRSMQINYWKKKQKKRQRWISRLKQIGRVLEISCMSRPIKNELKRKRTKMKKKESESYLLYLTIDESRRNSKTKKEAKRMKEEEWRHDWF